MGRAHAARSVEDTRMHSLKTPTRLTTTKGRPTGHQDPQNAPPERFAGPRPAGS